MSMKNEHIKPRTNITASNEIDEQVFKIVRPRKHLYIHLDHAMYNINSSVKHHPLWQS